MILVNMEHDEGCVEYFVSDWILGTVRSSTRLQDSTIYLSTSTLKDKQLNFQSRRSGNNHICSTVSFTFFLAISNDMMKSTRGNDSHNRNKFLIVLIMLLCVTNLEKKHFVNLVVAEFQHQTFMIFSFSIANNSKNYDYIWYFYQYG